LKKGTNLSISEERQANGSYTIWLTNIGLRPETMKKCSIIASCFAHGAEFFFGHYRTDGMHLTNEEYIRYEKEIPAYFQKNGRCNPLSVYIQKRRKVKEITGLLTVGSVPVNDETYEILPKVFHYYLETIFFCPKINWETFVQSYRDYMEHGTRDYVLNGYTDFLFAYIDSGDFSISFDPKVYNPKTMLDEIYRIMEE